MQSIDTQSLSLFSTIEPLGLAPIRIPPSPLDLRWKSPTQNQRTLSRIEQDRRRWSEERRKMYTNAVEFRKELENEWIKEGDPFVPIPALTYVSPNLGGAVPARGMSAELADQPFSLEEAVLMEPGAICVDSSFGGSAPKRMRKSISYQEELSCIEYHPGDAPKVCQDQYMSEVSELAGGHVPRKRFIRKEEVEEGDATPRAV